MLSLLSLKSNSVNNNNNSNKNNNSNDLPKIVDFNTIDNDKILSQLDSQSLNNTSSVFSIWPFNKSKKSSNNLNQSNNDSLLDNSISKVIAMKKIDSSFNNDKNNNINNEIDEEFIDIQLRQLSYAEVAALHNDDIIIDNNNNNNNKNKNNKNNKNNNKIVVIDQDDTLGKSVTDFEMVKNFNNIEKVNTDLIHHISFSPEDEWDIYVEGKTPKKLSRKKNKKCKKKAKLVK